MLTRVIPFLLLSMLLASCSNTKHLAKNETLFAGTRVHITDDETSRKKTKMVVHDLNALVRPRPNSSFLGLRLKLFLYTAAGDTKKKKGIRQWFRNKVGEPPVLASSVNLPLNRDLMANYLQNKGFFFAKAEAKMEVDSSRRKSVAVFDIRTGKQYMINKTVLTSDSSAIAVDIRSTFSNTLLTENAPYDLQLIKAERARIDKDLKENGYYYFKPDYILVIADTSIGDARVNLYVELKHQEIPAEAYQRYTINDVYIYSNYELNGRNNDTNIATATVYDGYHIIDGGKKYNPVIFSNAMLFEKGEEYNRTDQNATLGRLINLGTFKFVKNRFETVNDSLLDVYFYLTPYPKKSFRLQLGALTQNDNKAGSHASVGWKIRNAFKGAEEFSVKLTGGFEVQYSGIVKQPNIYNLGAEAAFSIPRFVVPFFNPQTSSSALPHSVIKLKYGYEAQSNLLRINSYTASFGYDWKEGVRKTHQLYPFNFTYVKTDTLGDLSRLNAYFSSLVFNGIIVGPTYEFNYHSQAGPARKHSVYFDGLIDLSGNILGLAQHADIRTNPQTLFGAHYAQYIKIRPDFRYYYKASASATIATRVLVGVGIPYGNSKQLPNVKQFWAGGNSDLRGFPSRLVGPGTFSAYAGKRSGNFMQTLGDMKLEWSAEYRHHIYKFLNSAVFFDEGNIWLYNNNDAFPGGQFTKNFLQQLAADAGFGLRFDFSILVLRLDLGIPLRKPWLAEGSQWVIKDIQFGDKFWRRENMVLNIGIGYPF